MALFGSILYLGGGESLPELGQLRLIPLAGALLATIGITGSIASRWGTLANALGGGRIGAWHDYYHYFIVSRMLGFLVPKDISDLGGRTVWLNQLHGLTLSRAGASVIIDRLFDMLCAAIFLLSVLPYWLGCFQASVGIGLMFVLAVVVGTMLFIGHGLLMAGATRLLNRGLLLAHQIPWARKRLPEILSITVLDRDTVLRAYLFSVVKFVCTAGRLVFFALALSLPISPTLVLLGTPLGQLSYLFAFTPGGLGIFEAGWFAILKFGGVATGSATMFVVGQRILTVVLSGLLALLSQVLYTLRRHFLQSTRNASHSQS